MAVAPEPPARLVRAVAAERAELDRHRARLAAEAEALRTTLARIEHGLVEIDERRGLVDRLAPAPPPPPRPRPASWRAPSAAACSPGSRPRRPRSRPSTSERTKRTGRRCAAPRSVRSP